MRVEDRRASASQGEALFVSHTIIREISHCLYPVMHLCHFVRVQGLDLSWEGMISPSDLIAPDQSYPVTFSPDMLATLAAMAEIRTLMRIVPRWKEQADVSPILFGAIPRYQLTLYHSGKEEIKPGPCHIN